MRTGVSPLVSSVLYIAIAVAIVGIVLSLGTPILDRIQDTGAITNSIDFLQDVDGQVQQVISEGRYSARPIRLNFQRGKYVFDNSTGEFYYEIDTRSNFISSHSSQRRGNLLITADAVVSVRETTVNGTDCYMMENEHLKACVRKIPESFDPADHQDLVGFWRFDEGSGQWANDSSSQDNDGTLGGSTSSESSDPSWASGIDTNALDFDGSDDYVEISDSSSLNISREVTVSAWINTPKQQNRDAILDKAGFDAYWLQKQTNDQLRFGIRDGGTAYFADAENSTWEANQWTHVTGTYDGSTVKIYVNGDEIASTTHAGDIDLDAGDVWIGDSPDFERDFEGKIDGVRIYDRALTAEEVEWLHLQHGDVNYINTSELLISYRNKDLDENLDPTMTVEVNANDDTVFGTGSATAERIGNHLGRGRVTATVNSQYGLNYDVHIDLLSGADFLKVDAVER